ARLLCDRRRDAIKRDPAFIHEIRRQHERQRAHAVLTATFHRVAETRNNRERRTSKRLKQIAVAKTVSEREIRAVSQPVIDTRVEAVIIVAQDWRRDEVLKRNVSVWQRIERRDRTSDRVLEKVRDDAVDERRTREWIRRNSKHAVREVAHALFRSRHVGDARDAFARACAFVISEEERAIVFDRTTTRAAKLVANVFGFGF